MKRFVPSLFLALIIGLPAATHAQLKPELQTGSLIPVKPVALSAANAGIVRKHFAQCLYRAASDKVTALLDHSNIITVDLKAAKIGDVGKELGMERCLGEQVKEDQNALGMRFSTLVLRDLMAEEAYLANNRTIPQLPSVPVAIVPKVISESTDPVQVQTLTLFADCAILADVKRADELLRTMPASAAEHDIAVALAPTLGSCLFAGQQVTLNPANIRALVAYAMWTRFGQAAVQ